MAKRPDFLVVGHVTKDLQPGGGYSVGGTATFAALTARSLGLSAAALTSAPPDLDLSGVLPGVDLRVVPSPSALTFENCYEGQRRYQIVHSTASPLTVPDLPPVWANAPIVLLGPLMGELGLEFLGVFPVALTGVTPQGWMRQFDSTGRVSYRTWEEAGEVLAAVDVLVFSEEDVAGDQYLIQHNASMARVAVVTRGRLGATVFTQGRAKQFPAFRAREVDPTGAGDVFAAAFLVRLKETGDPEAAAQFANCAASFAVEGQGTSSIPTRRQVEERLCSGEVYD